MMMKRMMMITAMVTFCCMAVVGCLCVVERKIWLRVWIDSCRKVC